MPINAPQKSLQSIITHLTKIQQEIQAIERLIDDDNTINLNDKSDIWKLIAPEFELWYYRQYLENVKKSLREAANLRGKNDKKEAVKIFKQNVQDEWASEE